MVLTDAVVQCLHRVTFWHLHSHLSHPQCDVLALTQSSDTYTQCDVLALTHHLTHTV